MDSPDLVFFVTPCWRTRWGDYLARKSHRSDPEFGKRQFEKCPICNHDLFIYIALSKISGPTGEISGLRARAAANKLLQRSAWCAPLVEPPTWVGNHARAETFLTDRRTVVKNLSEGNYIGEFVGEGRRLARVALATDGASRTSPVLLQQRVDAPVELRSYVIGGWVHTLAFSRAKTDEKTLDVRATNLTTDDVRVSDDWHHFDPDLVECTHRLGLDYAVFDLLAG